MLATLIVIAVLLAILVRAAYQGLRNQVTAAKANNYMLSQIADKLDALNKTK